MELVKVLLMLKAVYKESIIKNCLVTMTQIALMKQILRTRCIIEHQTPNLLHLVFIFIILI